MFSPEIFFQRAGGSIPGLHLTLEKRAQAKEFKAKLAGLLKQGGR